MEKINKEIIESLGFTTWYDFREWVLKERPTLLDGCSHIDVDSKYSIGNKKGNRTYQIIFSLDEIEQLRKEED